MNSYTLYNKDIAREVAKTLTTIGAIKLKPNEPFTRNSGWKSPIYCDNRLALSFPEARDFIKKQLSAAIKAHFPGVEAIAGVATAGIPQGALVADLLSLPFLYVRSKPKGHGLENLIEGRLEPGKKVVVLEDLVSTGGSSLSAVKALQQQGAAVLGMAAIFTYGFPVADENFDAAQVPLVVLSDYSTLLEHAQNEEIIRAEEMPLLDNWRKNPAEWGK